MSSGIRGYLTVDKQFETETIKKAKKLSIEGLDVLLFNQFRRRKDFFYKGFVGVFLNGETDLKYSQVLEQFYKTLSPDSFEGLTYDVSGVSKILKSENSILSYHAMRFVFDNQRDEAGFINYVLEGEKGVFFRDGGNCVTILESFTGDESLQEIVGEYKSDYVRNQDTYIPNLMSLEEYCEINKDNLKE